MVAANFNLWSQGHGRQDLVVNHYLLNIEAVGSWFQKIFLSYSQVSLWKLKTLRVWSINFEPRGMVGMIYVGGDHQTLLYTITISKYISCGPYRLWNRRFLKFF